MRNSPESSKPVVMGRFQPRKSGSRLKEECHYNIEEQKPVLGYENKVGSEKKTASDSGFYEQVLLCDCFNLQPQVSQELFLFSKSKYHEVRDI